MLVHPKLHSVFFNTMIGSCIQHVTQLHLTYIYVTAHITNTMSHISISPFDLLKALRGL